MGSSQNYYLSKIHYNSVAGGMGGGVRIPGQNLGVSFSFSAVFSNDMIRMTRQNEQSDQKHGRGHKLLLQASKTSRGGQAVCCGYGAAFCRPPAELG